MKNTLKDEILEILQQPLHIHPSREEQSKILRLERIVIKLSGEIVRLTQVIEDGSKRT